MSKKAMITLLDNATNGQELLSVLDSLVDDSSEMSVNEPTADPIEF